MEQLRSKFPAPTIAVATSEKPGVQVTAEPDVMTEIKAYLSKLDVETVAAVTTTADPALPRPLPAVPTPGNPPAAPAPVTDTCPAGALTPEQATTILREAKITAEVKPAPEGMLQLTGSGEAVALAKMLLAKKAPVHRVVKLTCAEPELDLVRLREIGPALKIARNADGEIVLDGDAASVEEVTAFITDFERPTSVVAVNLPVKWADKQQAIAALKEKFATVIFFTNSSGILVIAERRQLADIKRALAAFDVEPLVPATDIPVKVTVNGVALKSLGEQTIVPWRAAGQLTLAVTGALKSVTLLLDAAAPRAFPGAGDYTVNLPGDPATDRPHTLTVQLAGGEKVTEVRYYFLFQPDPLRGPRPDDLLPPAKP